jgi:hypothetical protein
MPEVAPFHVICPTCGRDSDAEDAEFILSVGIPLPGSEFLLADLTCVACDLRLERALWPVDGEALLAHLDPESIQPENRAVAERYAALRAGYEEVWERLAETRPSDPRALPRLDLTAARIVVSDTRQSVVDARVLAAAQACRAVALRQSGAPPAGVLLAGPFRCTCSVDHRTDGEPGAALHLSVSHAMGLGRVSPLEGALLTGLYFTAGERGHLVERPGVTTPCTHWWCPLPAPSMDPSSLERP